MPRDEPSRRVEEIYECCFDDLHQKEKHDDN
jgi:hypothetical protein